MLENPSMQQYDKNNRDNLLAADNQQGRPETEPSTTTRTTPRKRKATDKRSDQRCHKNCEGYSYSENNRWIRLIRDNCVWCMDCKEWKPIEQFARVKGKPYSYCKTCQRLHKAMNRYHVTRDQAVDLYTQTRCTCCNCKFERQTHQHIHHIDGGIVKLVCLFCNHILRDESPEHLHRLQCCIQFIKARKKI